MKDETLDEKLAQIMAKMGPPPGEPGYYTWHLREHGSEEEKKVVFSKTDIEFLKQMSIGDKNRK